MRRPTTVRLFVLCPACSASVWPRATIGNLADRSCRPFCERSIADEARTLCAARSRVGTHAHGTRSIFADADGKCHWRNRKLTRFRNSESVELVISYAVQSAHGEQRRGTRG